MKGDDDCDDDDDDFKREKLISLWQLRPFCRRAPIGGGRHWHATIIDDDHRRHHHRHRRHQRHHRHRHR